MQETMAAALLMIAGYQGNEVFYDPCFGSGTFLIEAALMATRTPPGYLRRNWGFQHHPEYSAEQWVKIRNEADQLRIPLSKGRFFGTDTYKRAFQAAQENIQAAGIHSFVEIVHKDFQQYTPPVAPNFVIANPPFGKRLEEVDRLRFLYRSIGAWMKQKTLKPAKGFVFTGSLELSKEVGLAPTKRHVLNNGGIESRFLEFNLY